jgi:formylmethanofuran dehydrogenase subunit B
VKDLNQTTRSAGLPLTGADNIVGANQVCVWQSGFPLRTSFARGYPEHDPWQYGAARLLDAGEADVLFWVSSLRDEPPPSADLPTIALTTPWTDFDRMPTVWIPVGTPGIDHAGQVHRTDQVVALPLRKLRDNRLPNVAQVASAIAAALGRHGAAA